MSSTDVVLVTLVVLWCASVLIIAFHYWSRVRADSVRYRFYAVRDIICLLAIDGLIAEDSLVFKTLVEQINIVLHNPGRLTLRNFVRSFKRADEEWLAKGGELEAFLDELSTSAKEVQDAVLLFYTTVIQEMVQGSVLLRSYVWFRRRLRPTGVISRRVPTFRLSLAKALRIAQQRKQAVETAVKVHPAI